MENLDDKLYKLWWYAVVYDASAERRMLFMDSIRGGVRWDWPRTAALLHPYRDDNCEP